MASNPEKTGFLRVVVVTAVVFLLVGAGVAALLVNIATHKSEAKNPFFKVVALTEKDDDPAKWGKNFPLQYDDYKKTVDQSRTRFGGSEGVPRTPSQADPRSIVSQSRLEEDPRLKTMWAGYAFSKDFREERGHAYMLEDQLYTERQNVVKQPGACLQCHASVVNAYKEAGGGDLIAGFEKVNAMPYAEARKLVSHPVSCVDCHDPDTMQLRVTRPGFLEGIAALKASQGVANYDVNKMATRQEMR
ncbi:MAG: ammonia-forming cytochrome c nitrite reductase subunit c552, partial [Acidobacteria bacterium]|nr:ammonia-forming cytochrome c nitrite reductase subunit c552 [Acidobacteriota bacterium]